MGGGGGGGIFSMVGGNIWGALLSDTEDRSIADRERISSPPFSPTALSAVAAVKGLADIHQHAELQMSELRTASVGMPMGIRGMPGMTCLWVLGKRLFFLVSLSLVDLSCRCVFIPLPSLFLPTPHVPCPHAFYLHVLLNIKINMPFLHPLPSSVATVRKICHTSCC